MRTFRVVKRYSGSTTSIEVDDDGYVVFGDHDVGRVQVVVKDAVVV